MRWLTAVRANSILVVVLALFVVSCQWMSPTRTAIEGSDDSQSTYSKYKGWKAIRGEQTGFFHVEQIKDKWWLIDPEGCAFLCVGINHVNPGECMYPYNLEHFEKKFGSAEGAGRRDREALMKTPFFAGFKKMVEEDFEYLYANTAYFTSKEYVPDHCAYMVSFGNVFPMANYRRERLHHPDIFDPAFLERAEEEIAKICLGVKDDPDLIGYCFVDVPCYNALDAIRIGVNTWQQDIHDLKRGAPGKEVFVQFLRDRYYDISEVNWVYGIDCKSFDDIYDLGAEAFSDPKVYDQSYEDDRMFLRKIIEAYYEFVSNTIKKYDTNHMILGDRFNADSAPPDYAFDIVARYVDVLMIQDYGFFKDQWYDFERWYKITGKPIILTDSCFSVRSKESPNPYGYHVEDHATRGREFEKYARSVYGLPYLVGWNWCGYIDRWEVVQPRRQHSGIKNAFGEPYTELTDVMHRVFKDVYRIHAGE